MKIPRSRPVRPQVLAPRGVIEDNCLAMSDPDAFALKAVDSRGVCIDFALVRTEDEYNEALERLTKLLDDRDPLDESTAEGRVKAAMYRRSAAQVRASLKLAR